MATAHAICAEVPANDSKNPEGFGPLNSRWMESAPGMASIPPDSIDFTAWSCSHTNAFQRCAYEGAPCEIDNNSVDGKVSLEKISLRDPMFGERISSGMKWRVIRAKVRELYPRAAEIIIEARNATGALARQVSEVGGLLQMHKIASGFMKQNKPVDWDVVRRAVLRQKPKWSDSFWVFVCFSGSEGWSGCWHTDTCLRGFPPCCLQGEQSIGARGSVRGPRGFPLHKCRVRNS